MLCLIHHMCVHVQHTGPAAWAEDRCDPRFKTSKRVRHRLKSLDGHPEFLVLMQACGSIIAGLRAWITTEQLPIVFEVLCGLPVSDPMANIGLAVDAAVGNVGGSGP